MTDNRWSRLASIAEIVSSAAILATLVFIVVEIRQNNSLIEQNSRAIRESAIQGLDSGVLDIVNLFSSSQETSVLIATGRDDYDALNEEQRIHFGFLMNAGFLRMDTSWWAYENGLLPQGLWERERAVLRGWLEGRGGSEVWKTANVSSAFREYVERELIRSE